MLEEIDRDPTRWHVGEVLQVRAQTHGDKPFLHFQGLQPITYAQVHHTTSCVAGGLQGLGIGLDRLVGVMLPNLPAYCYAWFALNRLGAVHVSINPEYRGAFLAHVLRNSEVDTLILHASFQAVLAEVLPQLPQLKRVIVVDGPSVPLPGIESIPFQTLVEHAPFEATLPIKTESIAAIMYTSGTTGPSKGVLMPHRHLYLFGLGTREKFNLDETDTYYICMPLFHANAMLMQLYGTLQAGAKAYIVPRFSASGWLKDVRTLGVTITNTLGVMTEFIFRQPANPADQDHALRLVVAVPAPKELLAPFSQRFGVKLLEAYGMTEINITLYHPLNSPYRPGSCGLPYDRYFSVKILDPETHDPQPPGQIGEICVRPKLAFGFMQGYHTLPEQTTKAWQNLWFHTGDAGYCDEDGYFYFADRMKDCIRRRGENISSYEVEAVLAEYSGVAEVAAIAVTSDVVGGEDEIKLCIVCAPNVTLSPEAVFSYCSQKLPRFALPRYLEFFDALPKTPTEKVQKTKLRALGIGAKTYENPALKTPNSATAS